MSLVEFLNKNVYIVSVVLCLIGAFLKQTPKIPNWSIPYILSVLGIIFCNLIMGFSTEATLQGFLVTGVSIYIHQMGKQCIELINFSNYKKS